mgnify:CR=1 FL=1
MLLSILALATTGAWAQSSNAQQDLEYRELELDPRSDDEVRWNAGFETEYYSYNNLDFRPLDESSDQRILDSDDRATFAFTGARFELGYRPDTHMDFVIAASHRGMWGNDAVGNVNIFGGWMYFNALYTEYSTGEYGEGVRFRVGRQFFRMDGVAGARDYILADVLDMVRVDVPVGENLSFTLIPINVLSTASGNDGADFVGYIGQSTVETFNFGGDLMTRRYGGTVNLKDVGPVKATAYGFYTDVGAAGSGSDITYDGLLGNFTDNDWVANFGIRAQASFGPITPYAHFDASSGIDRKEVVATDVDTNGIAYGGGIRVNTTDPEEGKGGFVGEASYFDAYGPAYGEDGLQYSHGYVGMKAQQAGGTLFNRFLGYHPTSYVSLFGVTTNPQDMSRKSATQVVHARAGYELDMGLTFSAAWWMMSDSGFTRLDFGNLDNITPPFGYSRSEFRAQQRLGQTLGHELDLDLVYEVREGLSVYASGAYIIPGNFQAIPIDRVAGTNLGTPDPAAPWAAYAGTRLRF